MSENTELHEGVKLLIARTESHPEEFSGLGMRGMPHDDPYRTRWTGVLDKYWEVLTDAEKAAINTALREANRKNFHSAVMKTIIKPDEETLKREYPQQLELFPAQTAYPPGGIMPVIKTTTSTTAYNTIK